MENITQGVPRKPEGTEDCYMQLRVSRELRRRIRTRAAEKDSTLQDFLLGVVLRALEQEQAQAA